MGTPNITIAHAPLSKIGDSITGAAKWSGTYEMMRPLPGESWDVRFMLLQAMATRMVAAISSSTANIDPNPERSRWLHDVSDEYENIREQLVKAMESCEI